jgi:hypothetical protein
MDPDVFRDFWTNVVGSSTDDQAATEADAQTTADVCGQTGPRGSHDDGKGGQCSNPCTLPPGHGHKPGGDSESIIHNCKSGHSWETIGPAI